MRLHALCQHVVLPIGRELVLSHVDCIVLARAFMRTARSDVRRKIPPASDPASGGEPSHHRSLTCWVVCVCVCACASLSASVESRCTSGRYE